MKAEFLSRADVARRLAESEWNCIKVKDYAKHSTWRTGQGFYFSVPHDCTEADIADIVNDLVRHGRNRNL